MIRSAPSAHNDSEAKGFGTAKHVLVIGCDGFGAYYMDNATTFLPNIAKFYSQGSTASITYARDQMPSVSAPNWSTTICGMGPSESGIQSNSWVPTDDAPPNIIVEEMPPISGANKIPQTMWRAAKLQNPSISIAVAESWDWIHYLVEPDVVAMEYRGHENDNATAQALASFITQSKPNLMFIHFDSIDDAGHAHGWGSPLYYQTTKKVDNYIGTLMTALETAGILQDTLLMLTADHGGYRFGHGLFNEACMYIPALYLGPGVKQGYKITQYTSNKDFAPTALNALGLKPGEFMTGRVVEEIYI